MSLAKSFARKVVFPVINRLGIEKLLSASSGNSYQILMYHGVVKTKNIQLSANHCSLAEFEKEILYLKKNFDIVPLTEIFKRAREKIRPARKTIAITFDDGYENNYTNAYKILKSYNVPATIFVVASCILNPDHLLWYDYLDILKQKINFSIFPTIDVALTEHKLKELREISDLSAFRLFLKSINTSSKYKVLEKLFDKNISDKIISGTDLEFRKMLSASQMEEMTSSGLIEIGSHSLTHPNLDTLSNDEIMIELQESKKLLEGAIKKEVVSIAFPDGAYNETVKELAIKAGYRNLLSVEYRLPSDIGDPHILPRFCISNTTTPDSNFLQIHLGFKKWGF